VRTIPAIGLRLYGIATVASAVLAFVFAGFAQPWQPIPDALPAHAPLTLALASSLLFAGAALQWQRAGRAAATAIAFLTLIFVSGWIFRVIAMPTVLGTWLGVAEQGAIIFGALACLTLVPGSTSARIPRLATLARVGFGLCCLVFGAAHIVYVKETAEMVPGWLPPNAAFWAYATGAGHILAGLALLSGIQSLLAARLLTAMFVGFGLLVWLPRLVAAPDTQFAWGGNVINLLLIASAWAVADSTARFSPDRKTSAAPLVTPVASS